MTKTEVIHETQRAVLSGKEPWLKFNRPRMILNLSNGFSGSHNFEGYVDDLDFFKAGDEFAIQFVRIKQVKPKWYEKLWKKVAR